MVNDKMVNSLMEKKQYIIPQTELVRFDSGEVMYISGPASAAPDPHAGGAPKRRDSVF